MLLLWPRHLGAQALQEDGAADPGPVVAAGPHQYPNCRIGLAVSPDQHANFSIVDRVNAGTHLDFGINLPPAGPGEAEYIPMVRLAQGGPATRTCEFDGYYGFIPPLDASLGAIVEANPGLLWVIGNEPDRAGQDNVCPQQYADAFHDAYVFIKQHDPSAQVAVAGLVQVTPMRVDYLDIVWDSYLAKYGEPMPVDVWTMHIYVLSEQDEGDAHLAVGADASKRIPFAADGNCADPDTICHAEHDDFDLFKGQVVLMREWMEQHGQQEKPLLLTEFGILKPYHYYGLCSVEQCPPGDVDGCFCDEGKQTFHPGRVSDFLLATLTYLLGENDPSIGFPADNDRLVQQVLWYRLATREVDGLGHASNIADPDETSGGEWALTAVGQEWQEYVREIPPTVNLRATSVPATTGHLLPGGDASVTLIAHMVNNGNSAVSDALTVTFYSAGAEREFLGSTAVTSVPGCARRGVAVRMTVVWPGAEVGSNEYVFELDSGNAVAETDESDNEGAGTAHVYGEAVFLPMAVRRP
jgi:hypothetical protein